MPSRILYVGVSGILLVAAGILLVSRWAESGESPAEQIDKTLQADAAKDRFTGRLGDFEVAGFTDRGELPQEAKIFVCAKDPVAITEAVKREELWSPAFEKGAAAWKCGDELTLINNEGPGRDVPGDDGSSRARGYFTSLPLVVARDAPRDRLELVEVEGHAGLLEKPVEGYPYGKANLVVIERPPEDGRAGIVVFVENAPSIDAAMKHAAEIIP